MLVPILYCWLPFNLANLITFLFSEIVDFFLVDTTPFVLKYWTNPKDHHYDWRGAVPRKTYIENLLEVQYTFFNRKGNLINSKFTLI
jgi:hypothetical protein